MRVGIVCPYSFDVPGGVQFHVRDLAEELLRLGHHVSVLAPADDETPLPPYVEGTGRAVPIRYNGSVARLAFGPLTAGKVSRWLEAGDFDVVHIHEPIAPSLSILALWGWDGPIVATFHTSFVRSRAMQAAYPIVRSAFEKINGRIAVSEAARETVITHMGGDAVVIPNGVYVDRFAAAHVRPEWAGTPQAPTLAFVGRIDEPRKGLPLLLEAMPPILAQAPATRLLVAGHGDVAAARERIPAGCEGAVTFLGGVDDEAKADLLASVTAYVAPHLGGESFGIVLAEAMAAGAPVVAADLPAFVRVLDAGAAGELFPVGDSPALAQAVLRLIADGTRREQLRSLGHAVVQRYDWSRVAADVVAVYETVLEGTHAVADRAPGLRGLLRRHTAGERR